MMLIICRKCGAALEVGTPEMTIKVLEHFDSEDGTKLAKAAKSMQAKITRGLS